MRFFVSIVTALTILNCLVANVAANSSEILPIIQSEGIQNHIELFDIETQISALDEDSQDSAQLYKLDESLILLPTNSQTELTAKDRSRDSASVEVIDSMDSGATFDMLGADFTDPQPKEALLQQVQSLEEQVVVLKYDLKIRLFLIGAAVVFIGILIGLLLPRLRFKSRPRSWL